MINPETSKLIVQTALKNKIYDGDLLGMLCDLIQFLGPEDACNDIKKLIEFSEASLLYNMQTKPVVGGI